jgi:hypothetical protein
MATPEYEIIESVPEFGVDSVSNVENRHNSLLLEDING